MPRAAKPKPDRLAELRAEAARVLRAALELEALQADEDTAYRAQELFFGAMELKQEGAVIRRCLKAVRTNPNAPDPLSVLADFVGGTLEQRIAAYRGIVRAGERDLGKHAFDELKGEFWGFIETRPYMRAKHTLARLLQEAGQLEEAIAHNQAMLELNPGDNQGLRYTQLGLLLQTDRLGEARKLWTQYEEEHSAFWSWGRVLLEFLEGGAQAARPFLNEARKVNPHAEAYLSGWKPLPNELPPYYSPGEESEAVVCAVEMGAAWRSHPEAARWLGEQ